MALLTESLLTKASWGNFALVRAFIGRVCRKDLSVDDIRLIYQVINLACDRLSNEGHGPSERISALAIGSALPVPSPLMNKAKRKTRKGRTSAL